MENTKEPLSTQPLGPSSKVLGLKNLISEYKCSSYIEVGVGDGDTIVALAQHLSIPMLGIDLFPITAPYNQASLFRERTEKFPNIFGMKISGCCSSMAMPDARDKLVFIDVVENDSCPKNGQRIRTVYQSWAHKGIVIVPDDDNHRVVFPEAVKQFGFLVVNFNNT